MIHTHSSPKSHGATVQSEIACWQCGYNLRSLLATARCPECGTAVALSLGGDALSHAHPAWLRRLHWGAQFSLAGILGLLVSLLMVIFGTLSTGDLLGPERAAAGPFIVGYAGVLLGAWLLSSRDPSCYGVRLAQRIARAATVVGSLHLLLLVTTLAEWWWRAWMLLKPLGLLMFIVGPAGLIAQAHIILKLAKRTTAPVVATYARIVIGATLLTQGASLSACIANALSDHEITWLMVTAGALWVTLASIHGLFMNHLRALLSREIPLAVQWWSATDTGRNDASEDPS